MSSDSSVKSINSESASLFETNKPLDDLKEEHKSNMSSDSSGKSTSSGSSLTKANETLDDLKEEYKPNMSSDSSAETISSDSFLFETNESLDDLQIQNDRLRLQNQNDRIKLQNLRMENLVAGLEGFFKTEMNNLEEQKLAVEAELEAKNKKLAEFELEQERKVIEIETLRARLDSVVDDHEEINESEEILANIRRLFPLIKLDIPEESGFREHTSRIKTFHERNSSLMLDLNEWKNKYEMVRAIQDRFVACGIPECHWARLLMDLYFNEKQRFIYCSEKTTWDELMVLLFKSYPFDLKEDLIRTRIQNFSIDSNLSEKGKTQLLNWVESAREHSGLELLPGLKARYARILREFHLYPANGFRVKDIKDYDGLVRHINQYVPIDHLDESTLLKILTSSPHFKSKLKNIVDHLSSRRQYRSEARELSTRELLNHGSAMHSHIRDRSSLFEEHKEKYYSEDDSETDSQFTPDTIPEFKSQFARDLKSHKLNSNSS
ncbi:hypothetical protein CANARDRAFT_21057 [[Candida] arabinofermentans NRRL YB-2248]|uniref:Uncharacterized protein n=1 Tax=[Candida] arabinofermentans NRRL YB-2248 TaxID=983967 RepID=A0A1E4T5P9_9ASCO|nr:hypothetical protein CANARDRAFT_21057 [[Candida] arabinofermentans NRRL YB-2248]